MLFERLPVIRALHVLVLLSLTVVFPSYADRAVRQYAAKVETSSWTLDPQSNRLECRLIHHIDRFGEAQFSSAASNQLNMHFGMKMRMLPDTYAQAAVYSMAPKWMPGTPTRLLTKLKLQRQFQPELPKAMAWTLLTELEKGLWPTFQYQDWYNQNDTVMVSLNTANFMLAYQDFVDCTAQLLPYSLEDIAFTILTFQPNSHKLTPYAQGRLDQVAEYLKYDNELSLVLVDSHTDALLGQTSNLNITQVRADKIKSFFTENGIDDSRIEVTAYSEKRSIAPDKKLLQGFNRRVVVQLFKAP